MQYTNVRIFISLNYTSFHRNAQDSSRWDSTIPTCLLIYFILYFIVIHENVGSEDSHVFNDAFERLFH